MSLAAGSKLGPYEILAPLGAGGMGEVYRARDTKLKREVALKVLPETFARDPDRMARFQREAEVLASLNHPNIAHLYGIEDHALVMELVEGVTLPCPLPIETALNYGRQIAEALEYAHERGVVHRDLKPVNIKITPEGVVKVLDFGLARVINNGVPDAGPFPSGGSHSPTLTLGATRAGMIMGTAAYMAPEQAGGQPADRRADIWSFGAVLYEMLAGKKAFDGKSVSDTLEKVLMFDPDWDALPQQTPASIKKLAGRCLIRDRKQRLQAIGEARIALENPGGSESHDSTLVTTAPPPAPAQWRWMWPSVAALLAIALGVTVWALWPKAAPARVGRFEVALPENVEFSQYVSLSPDGRKLLFNAFGEQAGLWIRDLDALNWRRLPDTSGARSPFWSPDSRFVAFGLGNQLRKMDISGGPGQTLCESATTVGSGSWSPDGVIVFGGYGRGPLQRVSQAGGVPIEITAVDTDRGETVHALPTFLPDGKHFVYLRQGSSEVGGIYVGQLDAKPQEQSKERTLAGQFAGMYADGYLFFMRENTLMAQPFDTGKLRLRGDPVPLVEHVATTQATGVFSVSPGGTLAYRVATSDNNHQVTWYDRRGMSKSTFGPPGPDQGIVISPDATRAAVRDATAIGRGDIWTLDFARGVRTRLTALRSPGSLPVWSPDGGRIAFSAGGITLDTIYEKASSGSGEEKEVFKKAGEMTFPTSWSPDGRFLLFTISTRTKTGADIWILPMEGDRIPQLLLGTEFNETDAVFSPDMRWIAYTSTESRRAEVYVRPFVASGPSGVPTLGEGKWQISKDGGNEPRWRADGKEIIFQAPPNGASKMAVEVKTSGSAFEAGVPQLLFQPPIDYGWDVTADGKRFLLAVEPAGQQSAPTPITVILNWQAELKK